MAFCFSQFSRYNKKKPMEKENLQYWEYVLGMYSMVFAKSSDDGSDILLVEMDIYVPRMEASKILEKRSVQLEIKAKMRENKVEIVAELEGGTLHMSNACPNLAINYFLSERRLYYTLT